MSSSFLRLQQIIPGFLSEKVEDEDTPLVKASQHGDQDAFAILVQRHQRRVFTLVLRMLSDHDDANEVTQEAFLAAWQGLPSFRREARFSSWLYRIAYRECLRHLEQRKRQQSLQTALQAYPLPAEDGNPEKIRERHEQQIQVHQSLSRLPDRYRIALILRHFHEKTYEEMAQILTLPIGTIKTHLFRARHLLKERLLSLQQEGAQ
jgi:RNA polymerase sigma-70 factor (ECF subfamily)